MSAATAEAIIEKASEVDVKFSDDPCKNGYLTENNQKEYLIEIVKDVIREEVPEDEDEDDIASTNLVVGKVVEVKEDLNVSGDLRDSKTILINGCDNKVINTEEPVDVTSDLITDISKTIVQNEVKAQTDSVFSEKDSLQSVNKDYLNSTVRRDTKVSLINVNNSIKIKEDNFDNSRSVGKETCNIASTIESDNLNQVHTDSIQPSINGDSDTTTNSMCKNEIVVFVNSEQTLANGNLESSTGKYEILDHVKCVKSTNEIKEIAQEKSSLEKEEITPLVENTIDSENIPSKEEPLGTESSSIEKKEITPLAENTIGSANILPSKEEPLNAESSSIEKEEITPLTENTIDSANIPSKDEPLTAESSSIEKEEITPLAESTTDSAYIPSKEESLSAESSSIKTEEMTPTVKNTIDSANNPSKEEPNAESSFIEKEEITPLTENTIDSANIPSKEESLSTESSSIKKEEMTPTVKNTIDSANNSSKEEPITAESSSVEKEEITPLAESTTDSAYIPSKEEPLNAESSSIEKEEIAPMAENTIDSANIPSKEESLSAESSSIEKIEITPLVENTVDSANIPSKEESLIAESLCSSVSTDCQLKSNQDSIEKVEPSNLEQKSSLNSVSEKTPMVTSPSSVDLNNVENIEDSAVFKADQTNALNYCLEKPIALENSSNFSLIDKPTDDGKALEQNETIDVNSTNYEENNDKLGKIILKRPPSPNDDSDHHKKIKLTTSEKKIEKENKRKCTEGNTSVTREKKKVRFDLSVEDSNILEKKNLIIDEGVNDSKQTSEIETNKENNERVVLENFEAKKKDPSDKTKIKDGNTIDVDKLKKKEPKKVEENLENDITTVKPKNINGLITHNAEENCMELQEEEECATNENTIKKRALNLKKKQKLLDEDKSDLALSGTLRNPCPICSCCCKIKKNDTKILGNKKRSFLDIFPDNSENININLVQKLEELVGQTVADWATNKCDVGAVRKRAHFLEEEHDRLIQLTINLKKQLDDARCIIKRMIDEKIAQKSWVEGIVPLKVTRSVGMQVCTTGSAHVLIKPPEGDKEASSPTSNNECDLKSNPTDSNKENKGPPSNNHFKDLQNEKVRTETLPNETASAKVSLNSSVTPVDKTKPTIQTSSLVLDLETAGSDVDDDPEVQVIEPVVETNKENAQPLSNHSPVSAAVNNVPSATTGSTTPTQIPVSSAIYVLKPTDMMGNAAVRNVRQVVQSPQPTTPASEVIDLTDNDPVAWQQANKSSTLQMNAANRFGGTTAIRPPISQTVTKQTTINFVPTSNPGSGVNKVVTFPADSTTTYLIQRPNNPSNVVSRKTMTQPTPSSDPLLNALSMLPALPRAPKYAANIPKPPKPVLRICKNTSGIMLSWNFNEHIPTTIKKYQVYAFQEGAPMDINKTDMWKKVGDVDALPLPMACTLTQFKEGHKYFFVVRAMDVNLRLGEFSLPGSIMLTNTSHQSNSSTRV